MAIKGSRVTVSTSAIAIASGVDSDGIAGASFLVRNRGSQTVTLGGPTNTTSDGFDIDPGDTVPVDVMPGDVLYGIVASGTCVVHVLKVGA